MAGASIAYFIGNFGRRELLERQGNKLHMSRRRLDGAHRWFERFGAPAIFVSRFIPVVRAAFPYAAGVAQMPSWRFFALATLGSLIWITGLAVLGRQVRERLADLATPPGIRRLSRRDATGDRNRLPDRSPHPFGSGRASPGWRLGMISGNPSTSTANRRPQRDRRSRCEGASPQDSRVDAGRRNQWAERTHLSLRHRRPFLARRLAQTIDYRTDLHSPGSPGRALRPSQSSNAQRTVRHER
jgi:SNARE associated Golgi protein